MPAIAECLRAYVGEQFRSALTREPNGSVRPVVVGPPDAALGELFNLLTSSGQQEWHVPLQGGTREIVVLLVDSIATPTATALSRGCNWDYAVTVRNSRPLVLILASRRSWDNRPESLSNTTETLGELGAARRREDPLQAHIVATISSRLGLEEQHARELVRLVRRESASLEPSARDAMTWEVLENLLAATPGASPVDAACRAAGLPIVGTSGMTFRSAYDVLQRLGQFVASAGLGEAMEQMKATSAAQSHGVSGSLDQLRNHLTAKLFSPTLLQAAPSRYYRAPQPVPPWYDTLSAKVIADILEELNQIQPQDRLALACTNTLAEGNPLRRGPFVVLSAAELRASTSSAVPLSTVTFTRKVDRAAPSVLSPLAADPLMADDRSIPRHRRPIKYKVEASNHRPGTVDVLTLDSFECGGLVVARDAEANSVPVHAAKGGTWSQELTLARGGTTELSVLHGSSIASIKVSRTGEPPITLAAQPGGYSMPLTLEVENNDVLQVEVSDSAGNRLGEWTVQFTVRDIADVANSRFEALVLEHRYRRKYVPHAADIALHRLELGSYMQSAESWRPILACWADRVPARLTVDWNAGAFLGDTRPQIDPRRTSNQPPADVLSAREAVRAILQHEQRCLSEIDINTPALVAAISQYLQAYREWSKRETQSACWLDVLAVHTAEWNAQAGRHVATEEPVVVLLSPLHPLRLAWHAVAQRQLVDSLSNPCPAAGLVSPAHCPDAALLYLWDGQVARPRAFFSLPCEHPHWSVLVNTSFVDKQLSRAAAMQRLMELGLHVQTITGGFSAQQTQDSLEEVNRLLPARATLRVGIVGDAESSSACGEGVFRWSETQHSEEEANPVGCLQVEVFDTREAADPSPEELAGLSETTEEKVRWFKLRPDAVVPKLDLTIIDQLGIRSHDAIPGATRSAITSGCLYRVRLREDFQDARAIVESRVATTRLTGTSLEDILSAATSEFEERVSQDAQHTHFRFTPNQDAVGSRLRNAIFLSVTSSQIDPACIVRGAVGQRGYLWDYELPGVLGGGEGSLGYYLVAQPTIAMCNAVERAASLVVSPPPDIPGLLEEISRHGIPILKRLASGGSQSRGELGLLLATRLLQDSFRANAGTARLPVWTGNCIHLVLPVDPYEDLFNRLRRPLLGPSAAAQRPDLVVLAIELPASGQPIAIKLTPVEVKYRAGGMAATDMRDALTQAESLGHLLHALWVKPPASNLWRTCTGALLAQFLDFGFRIYAGQWLHGHKHEEWSAVHQRVMQDVLEGTARITVNVAGRLVVFDGSATSRVTDLDGDQRQDTAVVSMDDARALLSGSRAISAAAHSIATILDFSFPGCGTASMPAASTQTSTPPAAPSTPTPAQPDQRTVTPVASGATQVGSASDNKESAQPASTPQGSRVPPEARQQVREAFEGFIGNEPAVARLSNDLLRALIEQPPHLAKNYLFTGLPSTGKTELARRMSRALRLPFIKLDGRGVSGRDKLFELVNGELGAHNLPPSQVGQQVGLPVLEYPPLIVFIDEVHLVPRALQESLLTMLEAADRTVVLIDHVARVHRATFLFATTRASDVDAAFASRCDEIQLREYTEAEVAQILKWKLPRDDWEEATYQAIARFGRCVPRIAIQLAGALETAILVSERERPVAEHLDEVRRAREIDARGLARMDFEYLAILERANNPVGEQNILNLMRTVDKDRILNEVEPFLVRLGFVRHGPRGRELTTEGREYLLAHRARGGM